MVSFLVSIAVLLAGYFFYGKYMDRVFGVDASRITPAYSKQDGIDYVPMGWGRIFLIQFLNIAGLGPIFGALAGAMWRPVAYLWIVLGCVFGGAVHDYFSGMLSLKHNGLSISEIIGKYLGLTIKQIMRGFTVILMIIVGAVFIKGPAALLANMTDGAIGAPIWAWIVIIYYVAATLLPIDKLIGRVYPFFGFALLFMAVGITIALFLGDYHMPELTFASLKNLRSNSGQFPIFPMMFITIACGAVSGFHSTQSPLMARCLKNEKNGRKVFYGAMIAEGIVAMIWATVGMAFYGGVEGLNVAMTANHGNAAPLVNEISNTMLGKFGGLLALLGVVAAPITSGDTAFRSARLIVADFLKYKQEKFINRLYISIPLFLAGYLLTTYNFDIIWRYLAWTNQTLAAVVLWAITVYLAQEKKMYFITLFPAIFMTAVVSSYIFFAPEGFRMGLHSSCGIGIGISMVCTMVFILNSFKKPSL